MTKRIIILILFSLTILIMGCINNNDNNSINAKATDLKFTIALDLYEFSNINNITIYAEITNINNNPVIIKEAFSFYINIYGKLKTPSNLTYDIGTKTAIHPSNSNIELENGENIETSIPMRDLIYYVENNQDYNWSENGLHEIQFWYTSIEPYVFSNVVNFNITN